MLDQPDTEQTYNDRSSYKHFQMEDAPSRLEEQKQTYHPVQVCHIFVAFSLSLLLSEVRLILMEAVSY